MQILFPSLYITVQQLKVLLEYFPPEEGYLRIQLIQALFSHIIDLENMNMIIDEVLTFDERNEVRQLTTLIVIPSIHTLSLSLSLI